MTRTKFSLQERRKMGGQMLACGITYSEAARLLGCASITFFSDINALGTLDELFPNRPDPRARVAVFAAVNRKAAELVSELATSPDPFKQTLKDLFMQWLDVHAEWAHLTGHRERRILLHELVMSLGWTSSDVERATGWNRQKVAKDVKAMYEGAATTSRPSTPKDVFQATLRAYCETERGQRDLQGMDEAWYREVLFRWLALSEVFAFLRGIETQQRRLERPGYSPEQGGHVRLYRDLIQEEASTTQPTARQTVDMVWRTYVGQLLASQRPWPEKLKELIRDLERMLIANRRDRIWPNWSDDDTRLLDEAVDALDERLRQVVRQHYGLDGSVVTYKTIGESIGRSGGRAQQLCMEALGIIRRNRAFRALTRSYVPMSELQAIAVHLSAVNTRLEQELNTAAHRIMDLERRVRGQQGFAEIGNVDPRKDLLAQRIDALGLPTRPYNRLKEIHARTGAMEFVWQVVTQTKGDFLQVRNFGHKTLKELEEALADHGLRLGMKLSPSL